MRNVENPMLRTSGLLCLFVFTLTSVLPAAHPEATKYALILDTPPVAETLSRAGIMAAPRSLQAAGMRQAIVARQSALRDALEARHYRVNGAMQHLLNAVFVTASPDQVAELRSMPGVLGVVPVRRYQRKLNKALDLVNVPAAWSQLGGVGNAGLGVKIAIIDSGIDNTHPAFQDPGLPMPAGFPKCQPADCQYTSNKIIVARSYVSLLVGSGASQTRPDDTSARDLIGHGTALASVAAGETNNGPLATFTGVAPRAYLGNYKVFGSDEVNGYATSDSIDTALEDAVVDGMNVAVLSLGGPAFTGPADTGNVCGAPSGVACDIESVTIQNAIKSGMLVVVAAGNEGQNGQLNTTLNSISSPGLATDAIAVAAVTNSHVFASVLKVTGSGVPSNLQQITDNPGDSVRPAQDLTARVVDASKVGDTLACTAFPAGVFNGAIALIQRGTCTFAVKAQNAYAAGAVGVILTNFSGDNTATAIGGLGNAPIPSVIIGASNGDGLRSLLANGTALTATIPPNLVEQSAQGNVVASFSSRGPAVGQGALKPDIAAVGTDLYMAAQKYDPNGGVYGSDGYTVADGTSFSTPMVAGAAALVLQKHPGFRPLQVKSALVNTAARTSTLASGGAATVLDVGAGLLDAGAAVSDFITIEPATVSFGALSSGALPKSQQFLITNTTSSAVTLSLSVNRLSGDAATSLSLDQSSLTLAPGASGTVTLSLTGSAPSPGIYQGAVEVTGGSVPLHIPYLYVVGDGVPADIINLSGDGETGSVGQSVPDGFISFKVIDQYGVPVARTPVTFTVKQGGGSATVFNQDSATDSFGIAGANITLGATPCTGSCNITVTGTAGALRTTFVNQSRPVPAITAAGVVDAASSQAGNGIVPGSYITIYGTGLSDSTAANTFPFLPLGLRSVSVSFDAGGNSYAGRVSYVSPTQINVQVPWELAGQNAVQIKVTIDFSTSNVITVPVISVAPALFSFTDSGSNAAAALDESYHLVSAANPVARGHIVQLYVNALGAVSNTPADGAAALASPLSATPATPSVTIGGQPAAVQFSGLAPNFSGLYQVNVTVPQNIGTGPQPVVISSGGVASPPVNISVK